MANRRIVCCLLISFIFIGLFSVCCGQREYVNLGTGKNWFVDSSGAVQTNDFTRLQKEVPFEIVVPTYLPKEVSFVPVVFIKTVGMNSANDVDIRFSYYESPKGVDIEEVNYFLQWVPHEADSYSQINGISVLHEPSSNYNGNFMIKENSYMWYQDDVSFVVHILDFSEEQCLNIIKSMIK